MAENETTAPAPNPEFKPVLGFIAGLGGIAQGVAGIIDTGANAAEDIARGKGAIAGQRRDDQDRELSLALRAQGFERGDNKLVILAVAASAIALIILMR